MVDSDSAWKWMGAGSGLLAAVLIFIGFGLAGDYGDTLDTSSPATEIAKFYISRSDQIELGSLIGLVGLISFFWFLGYVRAHLHASEGDVEWLMSVAYGGGLLSIGVLLGAILIQLATHSVSLADAQVAKTLFFLQWNYVWLFTPPMIAMTLATSVLAIRFRALPLWVGWVGVAVSVTLLMPWIGVFLFLAWTLVVSVVLMLKSTKLQKYVR
ncbi:MAG: hypothetical protein O3A33_02535 [Chloroflexi bacterium]|nr:hypothetical protein [Chloroflexota bacterium]